MDIMKTLYTLILLLLIGCLITGIVTADPQANNTGTLMVSSNPSGAAVYLDSVYKGITPETGTYISIPDLAPREYTLTLNKTGYLEYITSVGVVANETITVSVDMTPASESTGTSTTVIGGLIVIIIILVIAFIVARRKKPGKPEKIELD